MTKSRDVIIVVCKDGVMECDGGRTPDDSLFESERKQNILLSN
jgi:hypothetical protein